MQARKIIAPALAAALIAAVGGGIWLSNRSVLQQQTALSAGPVQPEPVHGLIGSEKEAYFADPRVVQALARLGLSVTVEKAGSRSIGTRYDPQQFGFGFPSGAPAAAHLKQVAKAKNQYSPFYTPIVVASWKPIADILIANGVAHRAADGSYVLDLKAFLALSAQGLRWRDLKQSQAFATGKSVLLASTDVRSSNSASMYLALASYLANGEQVVQSDEDVQRVLPLVAPLFLRQGFQEASSAGPFEDYLALGMGKAPLLVAYESQMIEFWMRHPDAAAKGDMVMLYPSPTVYSKHVLVPFTEDGERVGAALETDPELQALAQAYGFRTGGATRGPQLWRERGIEVPDILVDVVEPPSYEWLERMIVAIEQRFG